MKNLLKFSALALSTTLLVACGGGGGGGGADNTTNSSVNNVAPVANAGQAQNTVAFDTVTLDGSGSSDSNGDTLNYRWVLTSKPIGSVASLSSTTSVNPTFTADSVGNYTATLIVNDGKIDSLGSNVTINARARTATYESTPSVTAGGTAQSGYMQEYWKIEFSGLEVGYCDALLISRNGSSNSYTAGLCVTQNSVLSDFGLSGIVDINTDATLNGIGAALGTAAPIFRGAFGLNGTGNGTWDVVGSSLSGTWTATRYDGPQTYPVPSLLTPQVGSMAAIQNGISGIWNRPSITNWPEIALVTPSNSVIWNARSPTNGMGRIFGDMAFTDNVWSLKSGAVFFDGTGSQTDVNANGTVVLASKITGTMSIGNSSPVTLSFDSYSNSNALAVGLSEIAGTYVADDVFYIGKDGTVIGTSGMAQAGCRIRGKVSELTPGAKFNMFKVVLQYYGTCERGLVSDSWTGLMYWQAENADRYMYSILQPSNPSFGARGVFSTFFGGRKIR